MGRTFKQTLARAEADHQMYRRPTIGIHTFQLAVVSFLLELGRWATTERTADSDTALLEEYKEFESSARLFLSPPGRRR